MFTKSNYSLKNDDGLETDFLVKRPRRNRQSSALRAILQETYLHPSQLVSPLFVINGINTAEPIAAMPGIFRYSPDLLAKEAATLYALGIRGVNIFCAIPEEQKNARGTEATRRGNLLQTAIDCVKNAVPEMCVMADIALDPFTDHGHDGLLNQRGYVDNDATLEVLASMAVLAAESGADIVAPSDMMDGRVIKIRTALDREGFSQTGILAYAAKYASSFYGPFREALRSAPKFGDKKTYQLNPANSREALLECTLDEAEGADMILIKPALAYLDIISKVKDRTHLPVGAYHVSGEYSMVMAAAQNGWLDAPRVFEESLLSIRRAGADFILTYAAKSIAEKGCFL